MKLDFKNRIALYYLMATSVISILAFVFIYFMVKDTMYDSLDHSLSYEARKHLSEIAVVADTIYFTHKKEWEETEHREVQINPVFLQLMDTEGQIMDKSPNLKEDHLVMNHAFSGDTHYNTQLKDRPIRQTQIDIKQEGTVKGYIVAAIPIESSLMVLSNLSRTLLGLFPLTMVMLFLISRYLAGKSIRPISAIIHTTGRITKNNLGERVPLPTQKDELYDLSTSINGLLNRIEEALEREKQFTSDASHELRTPLSTLRGTLEILVRKERNISEYEENIRKSLVEVDRMSEIVEQLLFLARNGQASDPSLQQTVALAVLVDEVLSRQHKAIKAKQLRISMESNSWGNFEVPYYYGSVILENILGNAIKYSHMDGRVVIELNGDPAGCYCLVTDQGVGIKAEDLDHIYYPFFRSDYLKHKQIKGLGLGLSIARKAALAIGAKITIDSELGNWTAVRVSFDQKVS
ncbi:sensor histidine kinase [Echinicola strongylocentroti]|nr:ATP-binding protein [Echinicola strongylocentroti]